MSLSRFSGIRDAYEFAYGINPNVAALKVRAGNTVTGSPVVITVEYGQITLADGTLVTPFSTTAPITIGVGATAETVTPSAVSNPTPTQVGTCQLTVTLANVHGENEPVASGTYGMAEAVNHVHARLGGLVSFDARWIAVGGATSQFAGKTYGWANVTLLDWRGTTAAKSWIAANAGAYAASAVNLY